jgi:hypothetical protein
MTFAHLFCQLHEPIELNYESADDPEEDILLTECLNEMNVNDDNK